MDEPAAAQGLDTTEIRRLVADLGHRPSSRRYRERWDSWQERIRDLRGGTEESRRHAERLDAYICVNFREPDSRSAIARTLGAAITARRVGDLASTIGPRATSVTPSVGGSGVQYRPLGGGEARFDPTSGGGQGYRPVQPNDAGTRFDPTRAEDGSGYETREPSTAACHECGRETVETCQRCLRPTCDGSYYERAHLGLCTCCHAELSSLGLSVMSWPYPLRQPIPKPAR